MSKPKLDKTKLDAFIINGLEEDVKDGDHTSLACIPPRQNSKAKLLVKDNGIIAGIAVAERIFKHLDPKATLDLRINDGDNVKYGDVAFYLECNSQALLKGERLALNTMQRLSGVSTLSRKFQKEVRGLDVKILDTRKTTPLMRFLEKWAVALGGCTNYRDGLYDWIMIKDNHIDAAGSITKAIRKVNKYLKKNELDLGITVEVRNLNELEEVLEEGNITRIMLDNFELIDIKKALKKINGKFESEVSGGVRLNVVKPLAETGVNFISVGALTHSAHSLDLSLKIIK
ncbi:MAG: carboxylating nicotinate-nucleotide diphosphorylase [Saprospiraceae bacterium]